MTKCYHCRRRVRESERRDRWVPRASDMPAHLDVDGGCRFCCPTEDEDDAARDAAYEHRGDLMRDEGGR